MATDRLRVSVNPKEFLYISNILSLSRVLILPLIVFGLTKKTTSHKIFTLTVMTLAIVTDGLDGYMARCCAPMLQMEPASVRQRFQQSRLLEFELVEVNDITPAVTDVQVRVNIETRDDISSSIYEFRLVGSNEEGDLAYAWSDYMVWGITTWRVAR